MFLWWFFKWVEESEYRKEYKGLPRGCCIVNCWVYVADQKKKVGLAMMGASC